MTSQRFDEKELVGTLLRGIRPSETYVVQQCSRGMLVFACLSAQSSLVYLHLYQRLLSGVTI